MPREEIAKQLKEVQQKEGDKAPVFTGADQNGKKISLADFKGIKVALYFYPEDDTPTCTIQACNIRDNYSLLKKRGIHILGISPDDEMKHKKFEEKFNKSKTVHSIMRHVAEKIEMDLANSLFAIQP